MCYEFTSLRSFDLISISTFIASNVTRAIIRLKANDNIAFGQMLIKHVYDRNHKFIIFNEEDWVLLRLHTGYEISIIVILGKKLSQQYSRPFRILKKIDKLAYKLDLLIHYAIWPVIFVAHLEPFSPPSEDPYARVAPLASSIHVDDDTKNVRSYEIEKLLAKRLINRGVEYLVR